MTNPQPPQLSAEAALLKIQLIEDDLRHQVSIRTARIVVTGTVALGAERGDAWLEEYRCSPRQALEKVRLSEDQLGQVVDELGIVQAIEELERAGLADRTISQLTATLSGLDRAERAKVAETMLQRSAEPFSGLFTIPPELAQLGAHAAVELGPQLREGLTEDAISVFDPQVGCGEMILALSRELAGSARPLAVSGCEPSAEKLAIARASLSLTNVVIGELRPSSWLTEHPSSVQSLNFNYLVTALEATPWAHLDNHLIDGGLRPRSSDASLLYVARIVQAISYLQQSIAVAFVNAASLSTGSSSSGDSHLRRFIVESGHLWAVVSLPSNLFVQTSLAPTMLIFRARGGQEGGYIRYVDARSLGSRQDRRQKVLSEGDISEIISSLRDRAHHLRSDVPLEKVGEDKRWRIPSMAFGGWGSGPGGTQHEDRLDHLCSILPGRNRVYKKGGEGSDYRVVPAGAITDELAAWTDLPQADAMKSSSVRVQPGDIIGSISPPHGRWALVPEGYGLALASDHTVVLRRRHGTSMRYILEYLRSSQAKAHLQDMFRGTIPRLDREQFARLPVPQCPLDGDYIDGVLGGYTAELKRLEGEVDTLRSRLGNVFGGESPVEIAADVDALHGVTASLRSMRDLNSALRIAMTSYPYPISRTLRAIERTHSPRERYHEVVHQGLETICTVLAALCAGIARDRNITGKPTKSWVNQVTRNGATIGAQRSMFTDIARLVLASDDQGSDFGGIGQALGDVNSPAVPLLDALLVERNRIHGDYPKSSYESQKRLVEYEGTMRNLLDRLSFLARWELRFAEAVEPIETDGGYPEFNGQFSLLQGDNPDWVRAEQMSKTPLYRGKVYAYVDQKQLLDLHPFLLVRDCPQCGAKEVYYPDSFDSEQARLKSIDRGHPQVTSDDRILRDLRSAFAQLIE